MSSSLLSALDARIAAVLPDVVRLRQAIHAHPELALEEVETSVRVRAALDAVAIPVWEPLIGTDVIGELPGGAGPRVALRADLDALPIDEASEVPYRSQCAGRMHACGHDGHTAMLVGAAWVLAEMRQDLPGPVRFIFQPGEEMVCAGRALVERGACAKVDRVFALHGWPGLPVGMVSSRAGVLFAAGGEFAITIRGQGGHGAMPERARNPLLAVPELLTGLLALHARVSADGEAVVTPGVVAGGTNPNVIPEQAVIRGTARYLHEALGAEISAAFAALAEVVATRTGLTVIPHFQAHYALPVRNTPAGYACLRACVDPAAWVDAERPTMAMEDFAFYLPGRDGALAALGLGDTAPLHNPHFDFTDAALPHGIRLLCRLALGAGR
jgi:amidohydrolase